MSEFFPDEGSAEDHTKSAGAEGTREEVEIVYEPAEVPQEMIKQLKIGQEGPAGRVKIDQEGFYEARALDSESEYTKSLEQSRNMGNRSQMSMPDPNKSVMSRISQVVGDVYVGDRPGTKGANKSLLKEGSYDRIDLISLDKQNLSNIEKKSNASKASKHGVMFNKMQNAFMMNLGLDDDEDSANVSGTGEDAPEEEEKGGIFGRMAAAFGGNE